MGRLPYTWWLTLYSKMKPVKMTTFEHILLGCEVICSRAQGTYNIDLFLSNFSTSVVEQTMLHNFSSVIYSRSGKFS